MRGFPDAYVKRYKRLGKVEKSVGIRVLAPIYGFNEFLSLSSDFMLYVRGTVRPAR